MEIEKIYTDLIIVGGGAAGLRAAVTAAEEGVDIIIIERGNTLKAGVTANAYSDWMAYGAAFGHADSNDTVEEHFHDIMVKGSYTLIPELTREIAYNSPKRLKELEEWGAEFDKDKNGKYIQILSDGATYPRACGKGAYTSKEIMKALENRISKFSNIKVINNIQVFELIKNEKNEIIGVYGFDIINNKVKMFLSKAVILATGGAGHIYSNNVFPLGMNGDGYAIAYRAGAELVNMEYIQIGPCIIRPFKFALSGVFWRLNLKLVNNKGEEFLSKYIPSSVSIEDAIYIKGVSFPFTIRNNSFYVDVAIFNEIIKGNVGKNGGVFLDLTANDSSIIEKEAKVPFEFLLKNGLDIRKEPIEFAPAIQHFNGGILINNKGESSLKGLYACGEVAGGFHGADRPGGDALASGQVYGYIAGKNAAIYIKEKRSINENIVNKIVINKGLNINFSVKIREIRNDMYKYASIIRNEKNVNSLLEKIDNELKKIEDKFILNKDFINYKNLLITSKAVLVAILSRKESRGVHYREDKEFIDEKLTGVFLQSKDNNIRFLDLSNNEYIKKIKSKKGYETIFQVIKK